MSCKTMIFSVIQQDHVTEENPQPLEKWLGDHPSYTVDRIVPVAPWMVMVFYREPVEA